MAEPAGHAALAPVKQFPRGGPGDLGNKAAFLGERRAASGGCVQVHTETIDLARPRGEADGQVSMRAAAVGGGRGPLAASRATGAAGILGG